MTALYIDSLTSTLREELSTQQVVTVVLPTESRGVLRIRKGTHRNLCLERSTGRYKVPLEILAPVKKWTPTA